MFLCMSLKQWELISSYTKVRAKNVTKCLKRAASLTVRDFTFFVFSSSCKSLFSASFTLLSMYWHLQGRMGCYCCIHATKGVERKVSTMYFYKTANRQYVHSGGDPRIHYWLTSGESILPPSLSDC